MKKGRVASIIKNEFVQVFRVKHMHALAHAHTHNSSLLRRNAINSTRAIQIIKRNDNISDRSINGEHCKCMQNDALGG